ncbi:unnamed protein product [Adineta steineri]|uniref:Uncharacterized protein n=2 Tax=Adineta steineri TaxID=433720 RepID=A0A815FUX2_9BILA|nr:unnamed protein product [Adineta steineri]CAF4050857.1 unnamed protein product [Adineta steineri]
MATTTTTEFVPLRIGIDFGGVLAIHDKTRVSEDDEHQSVEINMPDAMTSLIKLKESGHKLYLISYCGERRARETKRSLSKILPTKDFFDGVYFTQRTSNKVDVCRATGCDIMIEDRLKTLKHIHTIIPTMKLIWSTSTDDSQPPDMIKVESWNDIMKTIDDVLIHEEIRHQPDKRAVLDDKIHIV